MREEEEETFEEIHQRNLKRTRKVRIVETGKVFDSAASVAEYLGCSQTIISIVLTGRQESTAGVHLEYTGEWTK